MYELSDVSLDARFDARFDPRFFVNGVFCEFVENVCSSFDAAKLCASIAGVYRFESAIPFTGCKVAVFWKSL